MVSVLLLYIAVAGKPCLWSTQKLLQSPLIQKFSINGDEPNRGFCNEISLDSTDYNKLFEGLVSAVLTEIQANH